MRREQHNVKRDPFVSPEYETFLQREENKAAAERPVFRSFDDYVKAHPEGESFRRWVTNDGRRDRCYFYPTTESHLCIPGGYLWCVLTEYDGRHIVHVHDCDDFCVAKEFLTRAEAEQEQETLADLIPFWLDELKAVGYRYD